MFKNIIDFSNLVFIRFLGTLFSFFFFILVSNSLSNEDYGVFAYYYSLASLLSFLALFGIELIILKKVPIYHSQKQFNLISSLIKSAIILGLFFLIIFYSSISFIKIKFFEVFK